MSHPSPVIITPDYTPTTPSAPGAVSGDFVPITPPSPSPVSGDFVPPTSDRFAVLEPDGTNNKIRLTGDTFEQSEIIIDDNATQVGITVDSVEINGIQSVFVEVGDKITMRVNHDFGTGPEDILLTYHAHINGKPAYQATINQRLYEIKWSTFWTISKLQLASDPPVINSISSDNTSFPDEAAWNFPTTVTAAPAPALQVIDAINAADLDITASNAPGSDGSGAVGTASATFADGLLQSPAAISNDWTPSATTSPPIITS